MKVNWLKNGIFLTLIGMFLLAGCRKEIIHNIGVWEIVDSGSGAGGTSSKWTKIENSPTDIRCVEPFNGLLYMGGKDLDTDDGYVKSFNGSSFAIGVKGEFVGDPVADLLADGDRLWIGGTFSYFEFPGIYDNIIYLQNGAVGGLEFGEFLRTEVNGFEKFNNDIIVHGYFKSTQDNIKTDFIEKIVSNNISGFGQGVKSEIYDCCVFDNKLYVGGSDEFEPGVFLCGYWDGVKWVNSGSERNSGILDNGFAVESFNSELFFLHNKTWATSSTFLRRFDGVDWFNVEEIDISTSSRNYLKTLDGKLYLFGQGTMLNGSLISNVLSFDGVKWKAEGQMKAYVKDLAIYKGVLYAATSDGLYELK